jgi:transcription termination factor Rho
MNKNNKKILTIVLIIAMILGVLTSSVTLTSIATAKATDTAVTRTPSTTNPTPGSTFEVMLNIAGLQIGGIVETIPDGFAFTSTTHPLNQTYVSRQKVLFAVVNETSIRYEVRAPSEGSGTFSGTWYDALNEMEGNVDSTSVSVSVAETPMSSPTPTPSPPVPGFEAVFALAGLFVVAVRFLFRKRGGEGSE